MNKYNFLGEVNMVSDLPSYVKYWRNKFTRKMEDISQHSGKQGHKTESVMPIILAEYTTCLQMNIDECASLPKNIDGTEENSNSKQDFFFLSDVLPEEKVIRCFRH